MSKVLSFIFAIAISFQVLAADFAWSVADTQASRSVIGVGAPADTFGEGATDGLALDHTGGFAVWVCADAAQTITTAFALTAYARHPYLNVWGPAPVWDYSGESTGVRCEYLQSFKVFSPAGRVAYVPSAGAVSSGDITIWIIATSSGGDLI